MESQTKRRKTTELYHDSRQLNSHHMGAKPLLAASVGPWTRSPSRTAHPNMADCLRDEPEIPWKQLGVWWERCLDLWRAQNQAGGWSGSGVPVLPTKLSVFRLATPFQGPTGPRIWNWHKSNFSKFHLMIPRC